MNNKTKIISLLLVLLSALCFGRGTDAATASLYVSPSSATKNTGSTFSISAKVSALGSKVCVVKGTLSFGNLTCRSITVAEGIMAQAMPTCSNPHFLLGIPTCTTSDKTLFTVSVRAGDPGVASANFTGAEIIGVGVLVSSDSTGGNYTIKALPEPKEPAQPATPTANEGDNEIDDGENQLGENISPETSTDGIGNQPASLEGAGVMEAVREWVLSNILWLIILILLLIIAYTIWKQITKGEKDKGKK